MSDSLFHLRFDIKCGENKYSILWVQSGFVHLKEGSASEVAVRYRVGSLLVRKKKFDFQVGLNNGCLFVVLILRI